MLQQVDRLATEVYTSPAQVYTSKTEATAWAYQTYPSSPTLYPLLDESSLWPPGKENSVSELDRIPFKTALSLAEVYTSMQEVYTLPPQRATSRPQRFPWAADKDTSPPEVSPIKKEAYASRCETYASTKKGFCCLKKGDTSAIGVAVSQNEIYTSAGQVDTLAGRNNPISLRFSPWVCYTTASLYQPRPATNEHAPSA